MASRLPEIEIHNRGVGFELEAPSEALLELADAFSGEVLSAEITPDDGSSLVVRITDGLVIVSHTGTNVQIVGGRDALDSLADWLRFVAAGPQQPSTVRYHAHLEHFPGHLWLAAETEPIVVSLADPAVPPGHARAD